MATIHHLPMSIDVNPIDRILNGVPADRILVTPKIDDEDLAVRAVTEPDSDEKVREREATAYDLANGGIRESAIERLELEQQRRQRTDEEVNRAEETRSNTDQQNVIDSGRFTDGTKLSTFQKIMWSCYLLVAVSGVAIALNALSIYLVKSGISHVFVAEDGSPSLRSYIFASLPITAAFIFKIFYSRLSTDTAKRKFTAKVHRNTVIFVGLWIISTAWLVSPIGDVLEELEIIERAGLEMLIPLLEALAEFAQFIAHISAEMLIAAIIVIYIDDERNKRVLKIIEPKPEWKMINEQAKPLIAISNDQGNNCARLRDFIGSYDKSRDGYAEKAVMRFSRWKLKHAAERQMLAANLYEICQEKGAKNATS